MQTNDLQTSIEDSLLRCLYVLGKIEPSNIIKPSKFDWERCSRTDRGVSAKTIVASGKLLDYDDEFGSSMQNHYAVEQLNRMLPEDIRVFSYTRVSKSFHPHLNTHMRMYSYYLPIDYLRQLGVSVDVSLFQEALNCFLGTHWMKNYSGSVHHRNKNLHQFYYRTIQAVSSTPLTINNELFLHVLIAGNSFLYHQIRKMIGGAVAASCGSWSLPYLVASFDLHNIQVPLAPSTPLVLDSVAFRADKNVFLNKQDLARTVESGRKRRNPNPNRKYDTLLLLDDEQMRNSEKFFSSFVLPRMTEDIKQEEKEMGDFIKSLHLGTCYDI